MGKARKLISLVLTPLFVSTLMSTCLIPVQKAEAYATGDGSSVHEYMATEALKLLPDSIKDKFDSNEIWHGARNEDEYDHVYDRIVENIWISHFWDADKGPDNPVHYQTTEDFYNSWQKTQSLWSMALGQYANGNKSAAYEYLGHVAHLLSDMSVTAHVHNDMHPIMEPYEKWMTEGQARLTEADWSILNSKGMVKIPDNAPDPLYFLFYTTNQVADVFATADSDGDFTDNDSNQWMRDIYTELGMYSITSPITKAQLDNNYKFAWDTDPTIWNYNDDDGDLSRIRQYSYLYAIRAEAALYNLFNEITSNGSAITIVIDEVNQTSGIGNADFFVKVQIGNITYRNEGDQKSDESNIKPGWAFARTVSYNFPVEAKIELWDADYPLSYTHYDMDKNHNDNNNINFNVNLSDGTVSGDVNGKCGEPIIVVGDGATIKFHIIKPNAQPYVNAGPDQNVSEGDVVSLNGTFTDRDVTDTHTYLWHMESSSNGQNIPDSNTEALSFKPVDNGDYTFSYTVKDNYGAEGKDTVVVRVNNVSPTVGAITGQIEPVKVGTTVNFDANFTDVGSADTHTAQWSWGDGSTSAGTITQGSGSGTIHDSHIYTTAGIYKVILTVTDDDGGSGTSSYQYDVVVYDPSAGFVTGGGWIDSPAGAYAPIRELSGKAIFSFLSKYEKGANVPTGNTDFRFRVADFTFNSTSYEWLVVTGSKAQYKGLGTINGAGSYGFILTAIDDGQNSSDKFRIKIWDKSTNDVIYDNKRGEDDSSNFLTTISGGSISIQTNSANK